MRKYTVTLVIGPRKKKKRVTVSAVSAVEACSKAESLNPGTLARGADIVPVTA